MSSNITSVMHDMAFSLNQLSCNSKETFSSTGRGERRAWEGDDVVEKDIKDQGGWAVKIGKQFTGGWENDRDEGERGKLKVGCRGSKGHKKKSSLVDRYDDDDMSPDFLPHKKRTVTKVYSNCTPSSYTQPDQNVRGNKHR